MPGAVPAGLAKLEAEPQGAAQPQGAAEPQGAAAPASEYERRRKRAREALEARGELPGRRGGGDDEGEGGGDADFVPRAEKRARR